MCSLFPFLANRASPRHIPPSPQFLLPLLTTTLQMGVYYMAPLLGPSVASVLGGVLTSGFNWRGPFWFLAIVSGCSLLGFIVFFKDTFRKERSLTYQNILRSRLREAAKAKRRGQRRDKVHGTSDKAHGKGEKGKQRGGVDEEDAEGEDADADITAAPTPAIPATPAEVDLEKGATTRDVAVIADGSAVVAAALPCASPLERRPCPRRRLQLLKQAVVTTRGQFSESRNGT